MSEAEKKTAESGAKDGTSAKKTSAGKAGQNVDGKAPKKTAKKGTGTKTDSGKAKKPKSASAGTPKKAAAKKTGAVSGRSSGKATGSAAAPKATAKKKKSAGKSVPTSKPETVFTDIPESLAPEERTALAVRQTASAIRAQQAAEPPRSGKAAPQPTPSRCEADTENSAVRGKACTAAGDSSDETIPGSPDEAHAQAVSGMFGRIAGWYDFLNHTLSLGQDIWWRHQLVRHVRAGEGATVLDLAAGTLDVSKEILRQHPGTKILAMDFARPMLVKGRPKIRLHDDITPIQADGRRLPLPDSSVDCATIAFGIRNILPRTEAFAEICRVLRPGGRLCVLEFGSGKNRIWGGLYNCYLDRLLPIAGKIVSGDPAAYRYLADTIRNFPDADELGREMLDSGFARMFHRPLMSGIVQIHVGEKAGQ